MGRGHAVFPQKIVQTFPFYFLKLNACSSRCASSHFTSDDLHFLLTISLSLTPFLHYPSFPVQCSRPQVGEPTFHPNTCMINVLTCNLYDELVL